MHWRAGIKAVAPTVLGVVLFLAAGWRAVCAQEPEAEKPEAPAPSTPQAPEPKEAEPVELAEVEVVATPIVEPTVTTRYGTQVSTVTEAQMEGLNAQDFPTALRRVPGVTISRYDLVGSYGGREGGLVTVRGLGGARPGAEILTMVDGVPKLVGVWTHPLMDVLNIENAERIDIYKSAQPVFHGNMSFASLDLIPKRRTEPGFETHISGGFGMYHTLMESFEHGGKVGRFDYYLVHSIKHSHGHRPHSGGQLEDYLLRLGYELSEVWDLTFTFVRTDNWAEDPGPQGGPRPPRGRFAVSDYMYVLTLSNQSDSAEGFFKLYWDDGHIDWAWWDNGAAEPVNSVTDYDNYGLKARQALHPWQGGEVVLGLDYDTLGGEFIEKRPSGDRYVGCRKFFHVFAPYVAFSQLFGEREGWHFIPSAGVRLSLHSEYEDLWTPQYGIVLGYGETELHANYARGFNYPGVYAVFMSESAWGAGEAWKRLEPETLDHVEVGLTHRVCPWLKVGVTAFWNQGENRIRFVPPPPPPPTFENIGDFATEGLEATLDITPTENLSAFLGVNILTDIEPSNLPYAPQTSLSAGLSYRFWERCRLDLDGQYVSRVWTTNPRFPFGRERVDDYWLFNGRVAVDVTPRNSRVKATVYVAVENIFGENYEYRPGYPMPGPSVMVGFDARL